MAFLTRRGALSVTSDLDRIASLFQTHHNTLGVPKEYALKFAYYCDALSDTVEKHAIRLEKYAEEDSSDEKEGEKKEAGCEKLPEGAMRDNCEAKKEEGAKAEKQAKSTKKKAGEDETGLSVDHGTSGFDANVIADDVGGPVEIMAPVEAWMNDYFAQNWFQQLREKQQGGDIGFFVSASKARLRRLAAVSQLSNLEDILKSVHAKLEASDMAEVKALAADVKKQVDAISKVRDLTIEQQAAGAVEPDVAVASERIFQAVTEQLPYLKQVLMGVDGGSPVALLEFQKMLGGGSLKELVGLATSIVTDTAKGVGKKDEGTKEASSRIAEEDSEDEDSEGADTEEEGEGKTASSTFGYDLFAV